MINQVILKNFFFKYDRQKLKRFVFCHSDSFKQQIDIIGTS